MAASSRALESAYTEAMGEWVESLGPWDYFVTLTFDPWKVPRSDARHAAQSYELPPKISEWCGARRFANFLRRAPDVLEREVEGVVALERHKSGQPHGHGLLRVAEGPRRGDIRALSEDWRGLAGNGWIRLERPKSAGDVSGYCAKYMTKDLGLLTLSAGFTGGRTDLAGGSDN
jgi:hypothetical protein